MTMSEPLSATQMLSWGSIFTECSMACCENNGRFVSRNKRKSRRFELTLRLGPHSS
jgi:hypothetical protein